MMLHNPKLISLLPIGGLWVAILPIGGLIMPIGGLNQRKTSVLTFELSRWALFSK